MKRTRYLWVFSLIFCALSAYAQDKKIRGIVTESAGQPVEGVKVFVGDSPAAHTNAEGVFEVVLANPKQKPKSVRIEKQGYELLDWGMSRKMGGIKIILNRLPLRLAGKVQNRKGQAVEGVSVKMGGIAFKNVERTNSKGEFILEIPADTKINEKTYFLVNKKVVSGQDVKRKGTFVTLVFDTAVVRRALPISEALVEDSSQDPLPPATDTAATDAFTEDTELNISPTLIVVVYNQNIAPAENIPVYVDSKEYHTDKKGEFRVFTDSVSDSNFEIPSYQITKKHYDYEDNYMFIHIESANTEETPAINTDSISYDENFNYVFNQLESEKQMLQQNGQDLRKEIMKISAKLESTHTNEQQKQRLEAHMKRLENALVENEIAYEDAQYKTREMLNKMKGQIIEQVETIEIIEDKAELFRKELIFSIIFGAILLTAVIALFFAIGKVRKQHKQLEIAHQQVKESKEEIEKQRDQMMAVRDIGQAFTAKLEIRKHMMELKKRMSAFFDVSFFGIGMLNKITKELEFRNSVKENKFFDDFSYSIKDNSRLSVWSFNQQKPLLINDLESEYSDYTDTPPKFSSSKMPESVIYLPLVVEKETLGVMVMHSMKKNAYKNIDTSVVNTLASYASIAISNNHAFDTIREKNRNITDSIRYAQTIQTAILPQKQQIDTYFSDTFILYRSKDIVSGDFYWFTEVSAENKKYAYLAVVDCTGHGVPGAFMSMIGHTLLNQIVNQIGIRDTDAILHQLDTRVKGVLRQEAGKQTDGMDLCLCRFEKTEDQDINLQFTGAKRPLMYVEKQGEIAALSGNSKSIASTYQRKKTFTAHNLTLKPGTVLYLTTDGFIDQHNKKRERFGTVALKELLEKTAAKPMKDQLAILSNTLDNHQQDEEQRDDITIIGVKL